MPQKLAWAYMVTWFNKVCPIWSVMSDQGVLPLEQWDRNWNNSLHFFFKKDLNQLIFILTSSIFVNHISNHSISLPSCLVDTIKFLVSGIHLSFQNYFYIRFIFSNSSENVFNSKLKCVKVLSHFEPNTEVCS